MAHRSIGTRHMVVTAITASEAGVPMVTMVLAALTISIPLTPLDKTGLVTTVWAVMTRLTPMTLMATTALTISATQAQMA